MNFNKIIDLTNIHEENISCLAFYPVIQFPTGLIPDPVKISRIRNSVLKTSIFDRTGQEGLKPFALMMCSKIWFFSCSFFKILVLFWDSQRRLFLILVLFWDYQRSLFLILVLFWDYQRSLFFELEFFISFLAMS